MKPHQLKAFLAVAELRSIRSAAKALFVSQPAVTRTMRELEGDLGVPLLVRSAAGVALTEYGKAFEARARSMVEEGRRAREELQQIAGGLTGSVRIAASTLAGLTLLPSAIAAFRKRMPGVQLHCADGQMPYVLPALRNGTLDFVLTNIEPEAVPADIECELLLRTPQFVGARADHPQRRRRSLAALLEEEWVTSDSALLGEAFSRLNLATPRRIIYLESFGLALGLVLGSDAVGFFSATGMGLPLQHYGIRRIPVAETLPQAVVSILMRRGAIATPAATTLLTLVRDAVVRVPAAVRG